LETNIESLWNTYEMINKWIRFSDTKATAILAVNGVIAGFYFSNVDILKEILLRSPLALTPLFVALGFIIISTWFSVSCIRPRLKIDVKPSLIFFSDVSNNYSTAENYEKDMKAMLANKEEIGTQLSRQVWANSKIAQCKYDSITCAIIFLVLTLFASIAFIITAVWG